MSYIAFVTERHGEVHLRGSERAAMSCLATDLAKVAVPQQQDGRVLRAMTSRVRPMFEQIGYGTARVNMGLLGAALMHSDDEPMFQLDGEPLDNFCLVLNTALALASDPVCLLVRLHAQCEIHAYVEGPNRAWLAELIQQGLDSGVYREGQGWDGVQKWLRLDDDEPVVTYSSQTGVEFPNPELAGWVPPTLDEAENGWDGWYEVPPEVQWRTALAGLRATPERELELRPDQLRGTFGHGKSLFDVFKEKR